MTDKENKILRAEYAKSEVSSLKGTKSHLGSSFIFRMMFIFLMLLLVVSFIRRSYQGNPITFSSFLNWLGNLNTFQITINISDFRIIADWGLFNGLRDFFNIFTSMFGVGIWFSANFINAIIYLGQFISFLFA